MTGSLTRDCWIKYLYLALVTFFYLNRKLLSVTKPVVGLLFQCALFKCPLCFSPSVLSFMGACVRTGGQAQPVEAAEATVFILTL